MAYTPLSRAADALSDRDLDVRGWEVRTDVDDEKVGKVEDMLLDESGRPRYLDVDLGLFKKHVLLPVGQARADGRRDIVWVPGLTSDRFDNIPEWDRDAARVDRRYEDRLSAAYRGEPWEDEADRETDGMGGARLADLDDLDDFRIPSNEPNPKGWDVITADGRKVGEVDALIVDTAAMKVRYLDCDLDRDKLGFSSDRERHVLLPMSHTRLDRDEKQVLVDGITADRMRDLPVYGGLPIASDFEDQLRSSFSSGSDSEREVRDEDRFFADRRARRTVVDLDRADEDAVDERRMADDADTAARARTASSDAAADTERVVDRSSPDEQVRIRVRGDEIIVERRPRE